MFWVPLVEHSQFFRLCSSAKWCLFFCLGSLAGLHLLLEWLQTLRIRQIETCRSILCMDSVLPLPLSSYYSALMQDLSSSSSEDGKTVSSVLLPLLVTNCCSDLLLLALVNPILWLKLEQPASNVLHSPSLFSSCPGFFLTEKRD